MSDWYVAMCLDTLRDEINDLNPKRDKSSDGGVGDTAHSARKSDHNPAKQKKSRKRVVRARDFDKDGIPVDLIVATLVKRARQGDRRLAADDNAYIIYNGVIWSAAYNWVARKYKGSNQHTGHFHLSCTHDERWYDVTLPWNLKHHMYGPQGIAIRKPATPTIEQGSRWTNAVREIQLSLGARNPNGIFGPVLTMLVKNFQEEQGLTVDGVVGPKTWEALREHRRKNA